MSLEPRASKIALWLHRQIFQDPFVAKKGDLARVLNSHATKIGMTGQIYRSQGAFLSVNPVPLTAKLLKYYTYMFFYLLCTAAVVALLYFAFLIFSDIFSVGYHGLVSNDEALLADAFGRAAAVLGVGFAGAFVIMAACAILILSPVGNGQFEILVINGCVEAFGRNKSNGKYQTHTFDFEPSNLRVNADVGERFELRDRPPAASLFVYENDQIDCRFGILSKNTAYLARRLRELDTLAEIKADLSQEIIRLVERQSRVAQPIPEEAIL